MLEANKGKELEIEIEGSKYYRYAINGEDEGSIYYNSMFTNIH